MRRSLAAALLLGTGLIASVPRPAEALTISLAFVSSPTIDAFGVGTTADTFAAFGFTGMTTAQIQAGVLSAVTNDYLGYPTGGRSPLPVGMQLIGNYFGEAKMLNVAHQYQLATDWHQRVPQGI